MPVELNRSEQPHKGMKTKIKRIAGEQASSFPQYSDVLMQIQYIISRHNFALFQHVRAE